jgi:hypothetical protein
MNNSYITILIESLEKKSEVLDKVIEKDSEQARLIGEEEPDLDAISENIDYITGMAKELDKLDDGFELVYAKVRDELIGNKEAHREEITRLKELITEVTEKSVKIQTTEVRNKAAINQMLRSERKKLGARRQSARVLNDYKHMMHGVEKQATPYFMDRKK